MNLEDLFKIETGNKLLFNLFQQIKPDLQIALQHGDWSRWYKLLKSFPKINPSKIEFGKVIKIGSSNDLENNRRDEFKEKLKTLMPWKKGPFDLFDIYIDSEWRSDFKWERLINHIKPLEGKTVLDIGAGNGYHMFRMYGEKAGMVIGIDPYLLYVVQFLAIKSFAGNIPVWLFPLKLERFNTKFLKFDTIFSMGVIYHQRAHLDHLKKIKSLLKPGGELVLETLVIDEKYGDLIIPKGRYAKMRNVWALPSVPAVINWLKETGYYKIKVVDVTKTTVKEQRRTGWMDYESLEQFLNPDDHNLTVEGYPAPQRAIFICSH